MVRPRLDGGRSAITDLQELRGSRELFVNLTLRELRSKYKRSVLGWAWSMVNPLVNMAVYTVVFVVFFKAKPPHGHGGLNNYALWLMCGLLPWNFFSTCVMSSVGLLVGNGNLIKKTYFPRQLLPASSVAAVFVWHLVEMGCLMIAMLAFGNVLSLAFIPVMLLIMVFNVVFSLGFGLIVSVLNVYFRDVEHFMGLLLLVWLYLTPILYPLTRVPHRFLFLVKLNPMTDMTNSMRSAIYNDQWPSATELGYFIASALVVLAAGMLVFSHFKGRLAEEL